MYLLQVTLDKASAQCPECIYSRVYIVVYSSVYSGITACGQRTRPSQSATENVYFTILTDFFQRVLPFFGGGGLNDNLFI